MNLRVETYENGSFCFNRNGIACAFYLEMRSDSEGVVCVHESFWKALEHESAEDQETIQKQLVEYLFDQRQYDQDPAHPLRGDPGAYKAYCQLRYAKLNQFHNRLLADGMAARVRELSAPSGRFESLIAEHVPNGPDREKALRALQRMGDPEYLVDRFDDE